MKKSGIFGAVVAAILSQAALADLPDELRTLLEQGKAREAYALGQQQPQRLGEPLVDFYFGVAATDAGHAADGVLALERYVLAFPDNRAARLELARALFIAGDELRAREEFQQARSTSQNDAETATIDRYIEAIRNRETRYQTTVRGFVEAGAGQDSNINGGVSNANITLPVFGQVTVLDNGTKKADAYTSLAAGLQASTPVAPGVTLFGALNGSGKFHDTESQVDQRQWNAVAGGSYLDNKNAYTLLFGREQLDIDSQRYRTLDSVTVSYGRQLDELQSASISLQRGWIDYAGTNDLRNADLQAVTLGWRRAIIHPLQPVVSAQLGWGKEDNIRQRPDLGREFWNARLALAITPAPRWGLSAGLGWMGSTYSGIDTLLQTRRKDDYWAADLTAAYKIDRHWSLRGSLIASKNDSNLALYEYTRNLGEVKVRYDF